MDAHCSNEPIGLAEKYDASLRDRLENLHAMTYVSLANATPETAIVQDRSSRATGLKQIIKVSIEARSRTEIQNVEQMMSAIMPTGT